MGIIGKMTFSCQGCLVSLLDHYGGQWSQYAFTLCLDPLLIGTRSTGYSSNHLTNVQCRRFEFIHAIIRFLFHVGNIICLIRKAEAKESFACTILF